MSQIEICDKIIKDPKHEILIKTLNDISSGKGVSYFDSHNNWYVNHIELCVTGQCINQSLLIITLTQKIAAGDIELIKKRNTIGKKEYYENLLKSVENNFNKFG